MSLPDYPVFVGLFWVCVPITSIYLFFLWARLVPHQFSCTMFYLKLWLGILSPILYKYYSLISLSDITGTKGQLVLLIRDRLKNSGTLFSSNKSSLKNTKNAQFLKLLIKLQRLINNLFDCVNLFKFKV